jgi:predicted O-methyltransferase YrrM
MRVSTKLEAFSAEVRRSGPVKAIRTVFRWVRVNYRSRNPTLQEYVRNHNNFYFERLGVSRESSERACSEAARKAGIEPGPTDSFHRLAFSALAISGFQPRNVLELGTSHGDTTAFLAELFPKAEIITVELPDDDSLYGTTHPSNDRRNFCARRLAAYSNVTELRFNTVRLQSQNLPDFDLIWLDAGHFFPEVAWDHFYCMHKLRPGGWLFTDDIMLPNNRLVRKRPQFGHAWTVIEYFNTRQDTKVEFLIKRENPREWVVNQKYVGFYQKKK